MVSALMDSYPDTFFPIFVHLSDGYQIGWGGPRFSGFYGLTYIPHNQYDGLFESNSLEADYLARREVKTDVTMELDAALNATAWDATATVCVKPGASDEMTLRIHMGQVLDHYPTIDDYYRNCLRAMASTQDVTLQPGECTTVTRAFSLDTPSKQRPGDVKFFAWAQEPLSSGPAEIHQAVQLTGYFEVPHYGAGFETGDLSEWASVSTP